MGSVLLRQTHTESNGPSAKDNEKGRQSTSLVSQKSTVCLRYVLPVSAVTGAPLVCPSGIQETTSCVISDKSRKLDLPYGGLRSVQLRKESQSHRRTRGEGAFCRRHTLTHQVTRGVSPPEGKTLHPGGADRPGPVSENPTSQDLARLLV